MTERDHEARLVLHEWAREPDPDPYQQNWKRLYLEAMIEAAERTELLSAEELQRWRGVTDHDSWPAPPADEARVNAHLDDLLMQITPMTRAPDDLGHAARQRFHHALKTLHRAGVIGDSEHTNWQQRALALEAPWLESDELQSVASMGGGLVFMGIPPESPEQELEDMEAAEQAQRMAVRGDLVSVVVAPAVQRQHGTAITAVVVRSESVEVHFHHLGPPQGEGMGHSRLNRFTSVIEGLAPTPLVDDLGTEYGPVADRPISSHGGGGNVDADHPLVITGAWRYTPAPPANAALIRAGESTTSQTFVLR